MKFNSAFDSLERQASLTTSMMSRIRSDAFQQAMEHQEWINNAFRPNLDVVREQQEQFRRALQPATSILREHQQEMMQKLMTPGVIQTTRSQAALMETLKPVVDTMAMFQPAVNAMAGLRPSLVEATASFAAHQKTFAQMARLSRVTALEETLQSAVHLFPTVHAGMPQADTTLPAFEYMEENQPELCQQVEDALAIQVAPDDSAKNIRAYMLFCTEIIIGLEGVKEVATDPAIKAGCVSLIIIFASLLTYLKYCKGEQ